MEFELRYHVSMKSAAENNKKQYNKHAKDWQKQMKTNVGHKYLEKPAMQKQLPDDLSGKDVLCVGVGLGDEISDIQAKNPNRIIGIDISDKLLQIAKENHPDVEFKQLDMMKVADEFPEESFDFIYSSLAFHYAKDWDTLLEQMYEALRPDGIILISTHHPGYWSKNSTGNIYINDGGVALTEHTGTLPGDIDIVYYNHPTVESIDKDFEHAGFIILKSFVPSVTGGGDIAQLEQDHKALKEKNSKTPLFYIVKARK